MVNRESVYAAKAGPIAIGGNIFKFLYGYLVQIFRAGQLWVGRRGFLKAEKAFRRLRFYNL